jgi:hypothetical protein
MLVGSKKRRVNSKSSNLTKIDLLSKYVAILEAILQKWDEIIKDAILSAAKRFLYNPGIVSRYTCR